METKICPKCQVAKLVEAFARARNRKDGRQVYCRECHATLRPPAADKQAYMREWYAANRAGVLAEKKAQYAADGDKIRERRKAHYEANRERFQAYERDKARKNRQKVLDHYGRQCSCCGETEPRFLAIDHIDRPTREERKEQGNGAGLYRWLIKRGLPSGFRTLCHNCNFGRFLNGGTCPHQLGAPPSP